VGRNRFNCGECLETTGSGGSQPLAASSQIDPFLLALAPTVAFGAQTITALGQVRARSVGILHCIYEDGEPDRAGRCPNHESDGGSGRQAAGDVPLPGMERDSGSGTAAFHEGRSAVRADCAPTDA
jgi:hypothetical protein